MKYLFELFVIVLAMGGLGVLVPTFIELFTDIHKGCVTRSKARRDRKARAQLSTMKYFNRLVKYDQ